jgi:YaiO family outer membrane protein
MTDRGRFHLPGFRLGAVGICVILAVLLSAGSAAAQDRKYFTSEERQAIRANLKYMIEGGLYYDYLTPHDDFGSWGAGYLGFFAQVHPKVRLFTALNAISRGGGDAEEAGEGVLGTIGATLTFNDWFYTNTALSFGSNSFFLPQVRVDQDFNFIIGLGDDLSMVLTPGFFYAQYFTEDSRIFGLFVGPTFYADGFALGYSLVRTESSPGSYVSYSHILFFGYSVESVFSTYLTFTLGEVAYLDTFAGVPTEVKENAFDVTLSHRQWIGVNWGFFGQLSYGDLSFNYEKWGMGVGIFYEF